MIALKIAQIKIINLKHKVKINNSILDIDQLFKLIIKNLLTFFKNRTVIHF